MIFYLRTWHRQLGVVVSLVLILLSVTGILLNHTLELKLAERHLTWSWLLQHYGIASADPDAVFQFENYTVSQFGEQIFLNETPAHTSLEPVLGVIGFDSLVVIAQRDGLLLLTEEAEFVEKLDATIGVPASITAIGMAQGYPILKTEAGIWQGDEMLEQWQQASSNIKINWSYATELSENLSQQLAQHFYGEGISIERVVLDIHNGHILGDWGVLILDAFAVMLIIMTITGLWMWLRAF